MGQVPVLEEFDVIAAPGWREGEAKRKVGGTSGVS